MTTYSDKVHFFKIKVDKRYTKTQKDAIGKDIVDYIRDRTDSGAGIGGGPWKSQKAQVYSNEYANSKKFKAAGKSQGNVDLELSSVMLSKLRHLKSKDTPGEMTIGYGKGDGNRTLGKVEGNVRGTYGKPTPIRGKKRNFMGLNREELGRILERYPLDDNDTLQGSLEERRLKDEAIKEEEELGES